MEWHCATIAKGKSVVNTEVVVVVISF